MRQNNYILASANIRMRTYFLLDFLKVHVWALLHPETFNIQFAIAPGTLPSMAAKSFDLLHCTYLFVALSTTHLVTSLGVKEPLIDVISPPQHPCQSLPFLLPYWTLKGAHRGLPVVSSNWLGGRIPAISSTDRTWKELCWHGRTRNPARNQTLLAHGRTRDLTMMAWQNMKRKHHWHRRLPIKPNGVGPWLNTKSNYDAMTEHETKWR